MEHACAGDDIIMAAVTMIKTIEEQRAALPKAPSDPTGSSVLQIQREVPSGRRAASWREILVPSGLRTIEGHLLGWLFSALRYPSSTSGGGSIAQEDRLVKASHLVRAESSGKPLPYREPRGPCRRAVPRLARRRATPPRREPGGPWFVPASPSSTAPSSDGHTCGGRARAPAAPAALER